MSIRLFVGLGNPGPDYDQTRHNAGAWFVEALAEKLGASFKFDTKLKAQITQAEYCGQQIRLMIPTTYMNLSGEPVVRVASYYKYPPEEILVAHDELDFAPGIIRFKQDGGHGGHNGLRDIHQKLNSNAYYRLRIGIGHPGDSRRVSDYVLKKPSKADDDLINTAISQALDTLDYLVTGEYQRAVSKLHSNKE